MATVAGYPLIGSELADGTATAGAWLAPLVMDLEKIAYLAVSRLTHPLPEHGHRILSNLAGRLVEPPQLVIGERVALAKGGDASGEEYLVAVGVPDAPTGRTPG